jgi:predicted nucleic acid-binding protein
MGNKAYVIDSSVLIAFYVLDDSCHKDAVAILKEIEFSTLIIHTYVMQEVVSVLTYKVGVVMAKKFIADIQQANNVSIVPVDVYKDLRSFASLNKRISLVDSTLLDVAHTLQVPLVTFDKELRSLAKQ